MKKKRKTTPRNEAPSSDKEWNDKFIATLKGRADGEKWLSCLLDDDVLLRQCAMWMRKYVDPRQIEPLYEERRERRKAEEKEIEARIGATETLIGIPLPEDGATEMLRNVKLGLEERRERVSEAFSVKRHGRDRSHVPLYICYSILERRTGDRPSYGILASLVNVGFEVENSDKVLTEENIRKNLDNFEANNPEIVSLVRQGLRT